MSKKLPPVEVEALAARVAAKPEASVHPLIGTYDAATEEVAEILDMDPIRFAIGHAPAPPVRTYCDSCGYVDTHAPDCPRQVELDLAAEEAADAQLEQREREESVSYLARRLAGGILRALARMVDPK